jgi:CRP-like cAMP-binding protein/RsiW-degrading membrane proteinase PrsW (M82 family)
VEIAGRLKPRRFENGETVIRDGEEGDECFLITAGIAEVVGRDLIGQETAIALLRPGETFGELALIGAGRPRTATVRARPAVETLAMSRADFHHLERTCPSFAVAAHATLERLDLDAFLKRSSPFARLPHDVIGRVGARARVQPVPPDWVVIAEGEAPDSFYVVRSGRLEVSRGGAKLQEYGRGDCFGEVGVLTLAPRNATVRAIDSSEVIVVDGADFRALVDEHPAFARMAWELAAIRGAKVGPRALVPDAEIEATLPRLRKRGAKWPWVFAAGTIALGAFATLSGGQPSTALDAAIVVGALIGPVTFVTYLVESGLLPERLVRIAATFLVVGIAVFPLAAVLEAFAGLRPGEIPGAVGIAVIEELAKLLAVMPLASRRWIRFQRDGVVYGAAAGMGFAAFETFLLGRALLEAGHGALAAVLLRALLSPFGHGTWTAIAAGGLIRDKRAGRFVIGPAMLGAIAMSISLHALWDLPPSGGGLGLFWYLGIGAIGLWALGLNVRRGVLESARSAIALNPELLTARADAPRVTCRVCGQASLAGTHYCVRCGSALRA